MSASGQAIPSGSTMAAEVSLFDSEEATLLIAQLGEGELGVVLETICERIESYEERVDPEVAAQAQMVAFPAQVRLIAPLVKQLGQLLAGEDEDEEDDTLTTASAVADALAALASLNLGNRLEMLQCGGLAELVKLLRKGLASFKRVRAVVSAEAAITAARALANVSSDNDTIQDAVTEQGALEPLVDMLVIGAGGVPPFAEVAAGVLRNLSESEANEVAIAQAGAIVPLVELLSFPVETVVAHAAGCLASLAAHEGNEQPLISAKGALPALAQLLLVPNDASPPLLDARENASATLRNLSHDKQEHQIAVAAAISAVPGCWEHLKQMRESDSNAVHLLKKLASHHP